MPSRRSPVIDVAVNPSVAATRTSPFLAAWSAPNSARLSARPSCPQTAMAQPRNEAAEGGNHPRQRSEGSGSPIQLAGAVVGDDHAVDAVGGRFARLLRVKAPFKKQWTLPQPAQPIDLAPGKRGIQ